MCWKVKFVLVNKRLHVYITLIVVSVNARRALTVHGIPACRRRKPIIMFIAFATIRSKLIMAFPGESYRNARARATASCIPLWYYAHAYRACRCTERTFAPPFIYYSHGRRGIHRRPWWRTKGRTNGRGETAVLGFCL